MDDHHRPGSYNVEEMAWRKRLDKSPRYGIIGSVKFRLLAV